MTNETNRPDDAAGIERPWNEDPWDPVLPTDDADTDGMLPDLRAYSKQILIGLAVVAVVFVAWAGLQVRRIATQVDAPDTAMAPADNEVIEMEVVFPEGFTLR